MNDTINLLKECDAGIKMGIEAIDEVLDEVESGALRSFLSEARERHVELKAELQKQLDKYSEHGKEPNAMAKSMSWLKTNMKMAFEPSDQTIASIVTDGCNMGVKNLNKYLNEYTQASEPSKELTKKLIDLEEKLAIDIRRFL